MAFCAGSPSKTVVVINDREQVVMVLAPTGQSITETFVRANLNGLPFKIVAYFVPGGVLRFRLGSKKFHQYSMC